MDMDAVHNPDNHAWIGEKIQLAEYFKEFHNLVYATRAPLSKKGGDLKTLSNKNVKRLVETIQNEEEDELAEPHGVSKNKESLDDELYEKIESLCDISNLTLPNEVPPMQQFLDPIPNTRDTKDGKALLPPFPKFQVK